MDNFGKAVQMAGAAFLFVIAASVAIFLYSMVIEKTRDIIVASDINNYSSEYAILGDGDYTRSINKDEIVFTVLSITDEDSKTYIDKIEIVTDGGGMAEFYADASDESILADLGDVSFKSSYTSEYDASNKILRFK